MDSNLAAKRLEQAVISEAVEELSADADSGFNPDDYTPPKSLLTEQSKPVGQASSKNEGSDKNEES